MIYNVILDTEECLSKNALGVGVGFLCYCTGPYTFTISACITKVKCIYTSLIYI